MIIGINYLKRIVLMNRGKIMDNLSFEERIQKFCNILKSSKGITFFGGAGVSTESGIPDFRSKDGLYNNPDAKYSAYKPEYLLSKECLDREPEVFFDFLKNKMDIRGYEPNRTHKALAELEKRYGNKFNGIITQNIDAFHQKAGSTRVAEIHGTLSRCVCNCRHKEYPGDYVFTHNMEECPKCHNYIRPDVTLYGEALPYYEILKAEDWMSATDLLIVGGTSLQVEPAASFVRCYFGTNLVIINNQPTAFDEYADILFHENIGDVFENVLKTLKSENENV